jgi:cytochrome c oxidase subunit III
MAGSMSAADAGIPAQEISLRSDSRGRLGMGCLIAAESALFLAFVITYGVYVGKNLNGPTPRQVLRVPIFITICLLSSSFTMHRAIASIRSDKMAAFKIFWVVTVALGAIFLVGTGIEWHHLIFQEDFTIQTNLFGAAYFSLVGLHAFHVLIGLVALIIVIGLAFAGRLKREHAGRCAVLSMYWHFVDAVWAVVFTVVYIFKR